MAERNPKVYKAAGILIQNRKSLIARSKGKDIFYSPGGKIMKEETPVQALSRELTEELSINVAEENLEFFGTFYAEEGAIRIEVYMVRSWEGEITSDNEIEELLWIDSAPPADIKIGSIFGHQILPRLKELNLID